MSCDVPGDDVLTFHRRHAQAGSDAKQLREMLKGCAAALRPHLDAAGVMVHPAV